MSENFFCKFCKKSYASKYILKTHQTTSKACLKLQENIREINSFKCEYCNKTFTSKYNQEKHENKCFDRLYKINNDLINSNCNLQNEIDNLKNENLILKTDNNSVHNEINELKLNYNNYKILYENLLSKFDKQQETIEKLATKAIENAGNKTITNNNTTNKNQIYNNLLPLTEEYMQNQRQYLTFSNVQNGAHGIAHFASNHTFKDRIFCSDKSRLNFVFKNENDVIIKDPEGIEITNKFIEINREELVRLIEEYLNYIFTELNKDIGSEMYKFWAEKREEFISIKSAIKKGNVPENKESYAEFKKNFLLALSNLVPR